MTTYLLVGIEQAEQMMPLHLNSFCGWVRTSRPETPPSSLWTDCGFANDCARWNCVVVCAAAWHHRQDEEARVLLLLPWRTEPPQADEQSPVLHLLGLG